MQSCYDCLATRRLAAVTMPHLQAHRPILLHNGKGPARQLHPAGTARLAAARGEGMQQREAFLF